MAGTREVLDSVLALAGASNRHWPRQRRVLPRRPPRSKFFGKFLGSGVDGGVLAPPPSSGRVGTVRPARIGSRAGVADISFFNVSSFIVIDTLP